MANEQARSGENGGTIPRVHRGISKSLHFVQRAQQRGLRDDVLEFILTWGVEFHRAGASHLTVMEKRLPKAVRNTSTAQKARDWVVLISEVDSMLTCYRRKNAANFLRKKGQRRLSESQLQSINAPTTIFGRTA